MELHGGANQKFAWGANGSLRSQESGLCLDVTSNRTANGTAVALWTCTGRDNQRWTSGSGTTYPDPGEVSGSTWAHDPTVVKRPDGTYLVAATGRGIPLKTSTDRTTWRNAGAVLPNGAPWTTTYTTGDLWAPDLSFHNGQYYLYYSASTFGSQRSAIFLATSPTGTSGTWTHRGLVIERRHSVNYNAIDPNLVVDEQGQWWLSFGSFWTGIKMIRIDPATGPAVRQPTPLLAIANADRRRRRRGADHLSPRGSYYYLFVSFDRCCQGAQSTYRIMVGRSTSVTGPYVDRNGTAMTTGGGTQILAGHGSVHGPGHQAVLADRRRRALLPLLRQQRRVVASASTCSAGTPPAGRSSAEHPARAERGSGPAGRKRRSTRVRSPRRPPRTRAGPVGPQCHSDHDRGDRHRAAEHRPAVRGG